MDNEIKVIAVEGTKELVIREGEALPLKEPVKLVVSGLIDAPGAFFTARKPEADTSNVIVSRKTRSIQLSVNESDNYGSKITGTLFYNKELLDFGINNNKIYGIKELAALLRMKRIHFQDRTEHATFLKSLNSFNARITTELKNADDRKGNVELLLKKETDLNGAVLNFTLDIAIFEGQPKSKLFVDVLADVSDASVKFWLESTDLVELQYELVDEIIDREIGVFDNGIVILEV